MSELPRSAICPNCKYNLAGLTPDETSYLYCPECGDYVRPTSFLEIDSQRKNYTTTILIVLGLLTLFGVLAIIAVILFFAFLIPATSS